MIYATLDVDFPEDIAVKDLKDADKGWPFKFVELVCWAKKANEKGRVLRSDGVPLDARAMARLADGRGDDHVADWEAFLLMATELGLLVFDDQVPCYQVAHWKRWHRAPSDEPEETAKRQRESRARKAEQATRGPADQAARCSHGQSRNVTSGHVCHDTEQSRAKTDPEHTPPSPPRGGLPAVAGRWEGNDGSFSRFEPFQNGREPLRAAVEAALARAWDKFCRGAPMESARHKIDEFRALYRSVEDQVLADCVDFAAELVADDPSAKIPFSLMLARAPTLIPQRLDYARAVEFGKTLGKEPRPWKYRREPWKSLRAS